MAHGKKFKEADEKVDHDRNYEVNEAFALLTSTAKESTKRNYDETVDVVFRLGVDPRKADQMIRGSVCSSSRNG